MSWLNSECSVCSETTVNRLNPFVIRCSNCRAKYNLILHWSADWLISVVEYVGLMFGVIYSILIQSLWPFGVGVALLLIPRLLGRMKLDKDDARTAHELLKRRKSGVEAD